MGGHFRRPGPLGLIAGSDDLSCRPPRVGDPPIFEPGWPLGMGRDDGELELLRSTLKELEEQANQFAVRFVHDSKVRVNYLAEIRRHSNEILAAVVRGDLSVHDGHLLATEARNTVLEAVRLKSSDIGRAYAEGLKKSGRALEELYVAYAERLFGKAWDQLDDVERNAVKLELVRAAGRDRPAATRTATRLGRVGVGLWALTLGIAIYNVVTAADKRKAAAREGATLSGNVLGGAAAGAAAGLICGPGAVVCSTVLVIAGGALGALGVSYLFDWVWE